MVIGGGEWFVLIWFVNSAYIDKRNIRTDLLLDPQNLFGIFGISELMTDFPFVCWGYSVRKITCGIFQPSALLCTAAFEDSMIFRSS